MLKYKKMDSENKKNLQNSNPSRGSLPDTSFQKQQEDFNAEEQKADSIIKADGAKAVLSAMENKQDPMDTAIRRKPMVKTYRDYAVNALKNKPTSLAKMIIKEKKKEEIKYNYSPKNKKNIFMILLSVILVVLGVGAVAAVIIFTVTKEDEITKREAPIEPKSVLYFDYKSENDLTNTKRSDLVRIFSKAIKNTNIPIGDVKIYYFIKRDSQKNKRLATAKEFFEIMDTRVSSQFTRSLRDEFTTGVISLSDGSEPFMIFKIKDFDAVFSAMFSWEKTMLLDMGDIFGVNKKYYAQKFSDLSLYNKDAKVILDEEGRVVFGYSFVDLHTLVFFTSNLEFKKLIKSLQNNRERN